MENTIQVRLATLSEIDWVNHRYDEVEFVHSHFDTEVIAIALLGNQKVGIGRLVTVNACTLELGGIYVFEGYRGRGVARNLVEFLLKHIATQTVYCIPFEHLTPFYKQCGFTPCSNKERVPKELLDKYKWCKEKYPQNTSLLVLVNFNHG